MGTFHVILRRSGPSWDANRATELQSGWPAHAEYMDELAASGFIQLGGPLSDEHRVILIVDSPSEAAVRETLARDPWSGSHLVIDTIEPWTIRLGGRRAASGQG